MFIFGSTVDCNHWRDDYNNCVKWRQEKNTEAAVIYFDTYLLEIIIINFMNSIFYF